MAENPNDTFKEPDSYPVYVPTPKEVDAIKEVLETYEKGRSTLMKSYNYFGGNNLYESIDDWTKRWNGYIPPMNPLLDATQNNIFINFTRNAVISYLSKVAMSPVKAHIVAVNKKSKLLDQKFSDLCEDLNNYSLRAENSDMKFLQAGLECAVKGTVVVYEGYARIEQETEVPDEFDIETGEYKKKKETRVIFDNCFQEVVPLEDFFITNARVMDVQKQPKIIWRKITSKAEAESEFQHYKNWESVRPGAYTQAQEVATFYRDTVMSEMTKDQVEVLRYYNRSKNKHIIMVNGVILYSGPIPFKDGKYPFAKTINEPFANDFFWGNGHPNRYMGEQDLINTFINAMADKTLNSLLPTGLSSDLDDLIDDDSLQIGKFRKVGDIEKWKWWEAPPVNAGEQQMLQTVLTLAKESANSDAGGSFSPKGGKLQTRQILQKQQEVMQKVSFNMTYLEDLERDRTELRLSHIFQFYSIPKIERITGQEGKDIEKMTYRDIQLDNVKLSDGRKGSRIIQLISDDEIKTPDQRQQLADNLATKEVMGDITGNPTEALALSVDFFNDFNHAVQVVKYSSFEKNQVVDQAARMEFANWRFSIAQLAPIPNVKELIGWVEEAFDIDTDRFETQGPGMDGQQQMQQQMQGMAASQPGQGGPQVLKQQAPSSIGQAATQQM